MVQKNLSGAAGNFVWELKKRPVPVCIDLAKLSEMMEMTRAQDFSDYFNSHRSI